MSLQYVELVASEEEGLADYRCIVGRVMNGKGKKSKQAITACGKPFALDDVIVYSSPSSSVMGKEDARPPCPECNGTDEAPSPATHNAVIEWRSPSDICASPHNHRKKFTALDELAASLRSKGMISPITCRPRPVGSKAKEPLELVVGERRWRASQIAELELIPVIVRDLSDKEVLEIQLVENVQRVDVHPLEEADGYQALIDKHKYTVEQLVAKTGKSKAYVYARLKLTALAPAPRKAFLEDTINPSVALMIARIPDQKLQEQATNEVLGRAKWNDYEGVRAHEIQLDGGKREVIALSVREAQVHLTRKYTLRLDQAAFPTGDPTLVPKAGACTTCSYRSGNQRELFSDVKSADVCTNPPCFEEKKKADWDRKVAAAATAGVRVLNEKETKKVFEPYGAGTDVQYDSPYVDPSDKLGHTLDPSGKKTWKSLLGTTEVSKAIALDGVGQARTLLDRNAAIAALKKGGKLKAVKAESRAASRGHDQYRESQRKRELEAKRKKNAAALAGEHIVAAVAKLEDLTLPQWRWLANCVVDGVDAEDSKRVLQRRGLEIDAKLKGQARAAVEKTFAKWIAEPARTAVELLGLIAEISSQHHAAGVWQTGYGDNLENAEKVFGFKLKALHGQVVKGEKDKAKAKASKKKGRKS